MKKLVIFLGALLLLLQISIAQDTGQGSIFGTVTDSVHAVIPGAQVTAVNEATGLTRKTVTNSEGEYRVDFLPPGQYSIEIQKNQFQSVNMEHVKLLIGESLKLDRALAVGHVAAKVIVQAEPVALNTTDASTGAVIESNEIQNLPLNGREFLALAALVPGAYTGTRPLDVTTPAKANYVVGYDGSRGTYNAYYVDGGVNTSPYYNNMISSPPLDAIQEVRFESEQYSARYGQSGGSVINVATKSGTNDFHGSLYEYHRNKVLDAVPYFLQGGRSQEPNHLWNQFGASIGGPIIKNRLFFFFGAEFFRQRNATELISFAPTDAERQGDVNGSINPWSGQPTVLTDPYTGATISSGILPQSYWNPVGITLMKLWPEPNYPENPAFNYRVFRPVANNNDKYMARLDLNISPTNTLAGTFNMGDPDYGQPGFISLGDQELSDHDKSLFLRFTHTFTPTLVSNTGFTYNQDFYGTRFVSNKNEGVALGMDPSVNVNVGMPFIMLFTEGSQYFSFGGLGPNINFTHQGQIYEDLAWQKGRHTIQFGGLAWLQRYKWQYFSGSSQYLVNLIDGIAPGTWPLFGITGSAFTDLLTGLYDQGVFGAGGGQFVHFQRGSYGLYVQDQWRVTPRFTLSPGLRWDFERPFESLDHKYMHLDYATGEIQYASGAPGVSSMQIPYEANGSNLAYQSHPLIFEPRLGFAWQPFGDSGDAMVLRGGYGIFHTSEPASIMQPSSFINPFGGPTAVWEKGILGGWGTDHLTPFNLPPYGLAYTRTHSPGCCYQFTNQNFPRSYMQRWNLIIGQSLPQHIVGEVAYVGGHGAQLDGYIPLQAFNPGLFKTFENNYPGQTPPIHTKGFNSNYNSLQVDARRNVGRGLTFIAAYTWSHALAQASNDNVTENIVQQYTNDVTTFKAFWANAGFDVRHRLSFSAVYDLPFGHGRTFGSGWNSVANAIAGGWTLNGIYAYQSGFPFGVRTAGNTIPNRVCNGNLPAGQRTLQHWFDYTCFVTVTDPTTGQPIDGNGGTNQIYGPVTNNTDLGIHKTFNLFEGANLQFRFEAFNAFNHPQFLGPTSGNWFVNTPESAQIGTAQNPREVQVALRVTF